MLYGCLVLPQHPLDVVTAFDGLRYHSGKKDAIWICGEASRCHLYWRLPGHGRHPFGCARFENHIRYINAGQDIAQPWQLESEHRLQESKISCSSVRFFWILSIESGPLNQCRTKKCKNMSNHGPTRRPARQRDCQADIPSLPLAAFSCILSDAIQAQLRNEFKWSQQWEVFILDSFAVSIRICLWECRYHLYLSLAVSLPSVSDLWKLGMRIAYIPARKYLDAVTDSSAFAVQMAGLASWHLDWQLDGLFGDGSRGKWDS